MSHLGRRVINLPRRRSGNFVFTYKEVAQATRTTYARLVRMAKRGEFPIFQSGQRSQYLVTEAQLRVYWGLRPCDRLPGNLDEIANLKELGKNSNAPLTIDPLRDTDVT